MTSFSFINAAFPNRDMNPRGMARDQFIPCQCKAALTALERAQMIEDLVASPLVKLWIALVKDGMNLPVLWGQVTEHSWMLLSAHVWQIPPGRRFSINTN